MAGSFLEEWSRDGEAKALATHHVDAAARRRPARALETSADDGGTWKTMFDGYVLAAGAVGRRH